MFPSLGSRYTMQIRPDGVFCWDVGAHVPSIPCYSVWKKSLYVVQGESHNTLHFSCHWAKQASVLFRRQVLSSLGLPLALCYIFSSFSGKVSRTSQHILGEILTDTLCSGTATSITCCMLGLPQHLSHMHFADNSWYNCSYPKYPASSSMRPTNWSANVVILSP